MFACYTKFGAGEIELNDCHYDGVGEKILQRLLFILLSFISKIAHTCLRGTDNIEKGTCAIGNDTRSLICSQLIKPMISHENQLPN